MSDQLLTVKKATGPFVLADAIIPERGIAVIPIQANHSAIVYQPLTIPWESWLPEDIVDSATQIAKELGIYLHTADVCGDGVLTGQSKEMELGHFRIVHEIRNGLLMIAVLNASNPITPLSIPFYNGKTS